MKAKKYILLIFTAIALPAIAGNGLSLIPLPAKVTQGKGTFRIPKKLRAAADEYSGDSIQTLLNVFGKQLHVLTGSTLVKAKPSKAVLLMKIDKELGGEAYRLEITEKRIQIEASRPAGFFYALQTLRQLLPNRTPPTEKNRNKSENNILPVVSISDAPRFGWRGFMLDEGRHFYGKEEIKKVLDIMAAYKMNRFHWHLTEDQGWRIEIKKYPRLTSTGAWRDSKSLGWGDYKPDGKRYGGFYTRDDIREIVKYAGERFIDIVPEIDIPGHSQAAVASYPEFLACDSETGHEVWLWQGISSDVINVSEPRAVEFAKDVINEITDIFPFGYLHLGGDECPTDKWKQNAGCIQELKEIGSDNFRDLQIDFYRKLKEHIAQKPPSQQKRLIFWNEVLHGNTAALGNDITIMAWVGADAAAKTAAQRGMTTILTPQIPYYINRRQSPLPDEPHSQGSGTETLEAVYNYIPANNVPDELMPRYLGVQANFWTEWVEDASTLQYLMLPRLAAVAEAAWTPQHLREYSGFAKRLQAEQEYYEYEKLNYGKHAFPKKGNENPRDTDKNGQLPSN